jgi:hypothetical protein
MIISFQDLEDFSNEQSNLQNTIRSTCKKSIQDDAQL